MSTAPALTIGDTITRMSPAAFVMLAILLLSIQVTLVIAPLKWRQLRRLGAAEQAFEEALKTASSPEALALVLQEHRSTPGARVVAAISKHHAQRGVAGYEELLGEARRAMVREQGNAEKLLPTLATIAGTTPLMGLFGTVWGIIEAFLTISAEKSSELTVIAPAMSGALLTTAFGLLAAMPATIASNYASNWVNNFLDGLDALGQTWSGRYSGK